MSWQITRVDEGAISALSAALRVRPTTARLLAARGLADPKAAQEFLAPKLSCLRPPVGLAGMDDAITVVSAAVRAGRRIGVFGDYDVDGVTTNALITSYLRQLGADVVCQVASRDAGYGFGLDAARYFAEAGCGLIITGDCGTSDIPSIEESNRRGIDVVVVDHHTVPATDPDHPHPSAALVNPFRADNTFPFQGMASVGLAFYMMAALRTRLRAEGWFKSRPMPDVRELLDLVALGTVADLVPLRRENRILTACGLEVLRTLRRPGIAALARVANIDRDELAKLDEETIGWKFGPRLNAPGRLGDAAPSLELLLATSREQADAAAATLEDANQRRRVEQDRVLQECTEILGAGDPGPAVVVAGKGWASGVVGIVAAKLVERYRRPAFVIAVDPETGIGRGSARSYGGVNLYQALTACRDHLDRFGGHAAAAGLTVRQERIPAVREALWFAVAESAAAARDRNSDDMVDAEVGLTDIDRVLTDELRRLGPFGRGNERPRLVSRNLRVRESRRVGDGSHLKLELQDPAGVVMGGIAFRQGELDPGEDAVVDAVFTPYVNAFRGREQVELQVEAFALSGPVAQIAQVAEVAEIAEVAEVAEVPRPAGAHSAHPAPRPTADQARPV